MTAPRKSAATSSHAAVRPALLVEKDELQEADDEAAAGKTGEHLCAKLQLRACAVAIEHTEDRADARGTQQHHGKMQDHCFRPVPRSKTSITASRLSMPPTIRNVLPYS